MFQLANFIKSKQFLAASKKAILPLTCKNFSLNNNR